MNKKEVCCEVRPSYASVLKENALITSQGVYGVSWRHLLECDSPNITLRGKERNRFMECYV